METKTNKTGVSFGIFLSVLAASLYAINAPVSKILLSYASPTLTAGFLYLGAGIGIALMQLFRKKTGATEQSLTTKELPYTIAMILLDILAPILLLFGLKYTSAASASLLNNFEIVATALIALLFFKELISPRLWLGIIFVTTSCVILSVEDFTSINFSFGSIFVLLAALCWGLENNCTRKISSKNPSQIVILKGIFSGLGSIVIGLIIGERVTYLWTVFATLATGFVAYGLSIYFYVYAQRILGAARTSAYYAITPFIGAGLSLIIFRQTPSISFIISVVIMILGAITCSSDKPLFKKDKN